MKTSLEKKVNQIISVTGFPTSYANNMLYAIKQSKTNIDNNVEYIELDYCVIKKYSNSLLNELTWSLQYLIGESILNGCDVYTLQTLIKSWENK